MIIWNKTLTCNKTGIYNYSVLCIYMYRSDQFYSYLLTYLTKSIYLTNYTATRRIPAAGRTALLRITMSPHSTCVHHHSPSEAASALYSLGQSVSGDIAYLHPREICHRDLKPENVLLSSSEDPNPVLKLSDLGRPDHPEDHEDHLRDRELHDARDVEEGRQWAGGVRGLLSQG